VGLLHKARSSDSRGRGYRRGDRADQGHGNGPGGLRAKGKRRETDSQCDPDNERISFMPYDSRTYRVLIGSPSDVEEEREIAVRVI
jgi:hypothetical protein